MLFVFVILCLLQVASFSTSTDLKNESHTAAASRRHFEAQILLTLSAYLVACSHPWHTQDQLLIFWHLWKKCPTLFISAQFWYAREHACSFWLSLLLGLKTVASFKLWCGRQHNTTFVCPPFEALLWDEYRSGPLESFSQALSMFCHHSTASIKWLLAAMFSHHRNTRNSDG